MLLVYIGFSVWGACRPPPGGHPVTASRCSSGQSGVDVAPLQAPLETQAPLQLLPSSQHCEYHSPPTNDVHSTVNFTTLSRQRLIDRSISLRHENASRSGPHGSVLARHIVSTPLSSSFFARNAHAIARLLVGLAHPSALPIQLGTLVKLPCSTHRQAVLQSRHAALLHSTSTYSIWAPFFCHPGGPLYFIWPDPLPSRHQGSRRTLLPTIYSIVRATIALRVSRRPCPQGSGRSDSQEISGTKKYILFRLCLLHAPVRSRTAEQVRASECADKYSGRHAGLTPSDNLHHV